MQTSTLLLVGAHSRRGMQWLERRLPAASRSARALLVVRPEGELNNVLWAEALRREAQDQGIRLSIGVAAMGPLADLVEVAQDAARAYRRAFALGGDMTVAHSNLLRAA